MLKKNVTLGWHIIPQSNVGVKLRAQVKLHLENGHHSRPLFLDWGTTELFKQSSHCEHVPTLRNMMLMHVVQNYEEWEPPEIPQHLAEIYGQEIYTYLNYYCSCFLAPPLGKKFGSSLQRISQSKHEDRDVSNISY